MIENYLTKTFSSYCKKIMEQLNYQKRGYEIKKMKNNLMIPMQQVKRY